MSERRRDRKVRETRERIFTEAIQLFERKGFAATKVREIAERAHVSTVTVHNHFRTKERLLHALAELYFDRALSLFEEVAQLADADPKNREEIIGAARRTVLSWPTTGRQLAADTQRAVLRTETGDRLYREMHARIFALVTNLQRSGTVRKDLDAALLASVAGDLVLGSLISWSTDLTNSQPPSLKAAELVAFLVATLQPPRGD